MKPDPFASVLHEWIGVFMRRSMRDLILYSRESGLSMSQMGALFHIHSRGACGVSEIGDSLGTSSAAASQMLERLVRQGLVVRAEDPEDRRAKRITVTDLGLRVLQESFRARLGWVDELAQGLSPSEQEQVRASLKLMIERANQLDAGEQA
ncbi:MAG TPA: MarR family transcriptional regulator [Anaerolineae bacterium]|nr:MarR family transcriptional regulator [Anaerolineae bacterium]